MRCAAPECENAATVLVFLYDIYENGEVFHEPDETCHCLCDQHMLENEAKASGLREPQGEIAYPYTNLHSARGFTIYQTINGNATHSRTDLNAIHIADALGITLEQMANFMRISVTELKSNPKPIHFEPQFLRMTSTILQVRGLFQGDRHTARIWINAENSGLAATPLSLILTGKTHEVDTFLEIMVDG